jgi:hypothetical protein
VDRCSGTFAQFAGRTFAQWTDAQGGRTDAQATENVGRTFAQAGGRQLDAQFN